ncbi:uncharacterized protein [Aegilops tauschii subsp. strangulata]|uniref:uncharacterized protein n=1 Tax=Aegilops tauschii subsp. strangulata TaxID=200361 RepID=UPI003CC8441F
MAVLAGVTAPSWALPISEFLENGVLPMYETEARQVQRRASAYSIINNELVKRSSTGVFQRRVKQDKGIETLLDIHPGECGHHAASRSLSNGQVERADGLILSGIKPRLIEPLVRSPDCWLDELPAVLWSLCTTPNRSTGFTQFFLVYRAEAVIPTDVEFDSPRFMMYTEAKAK